MQIPNQSPLDNQRETIEAWLTQGKSYAFIVTALAQQGFKTSSRSLGRAVKRWDVDRPEGVERPGLTLEDDEADLISPASTFLPTTEDLMAERGLDLEEWEVTSLIVNQWDSPTGEPLRQLKAHLTRIKPINMIAPARTDGPTYKVQGRQDANKPRLVVFTGDQQAPHQEPHLHELFCEWLNENEPDEGVLIGDTMDFPTISKYSSNPEWSPTTQQCIDSAYSVLSDYRASAPDTRWKKLCGNHDQRLRQAILDRLDDLYGLRRGKLPGEEPETPLLDIAHILRLDELGIEYVRPNGTYEHAQIEVSPLLAARHGWIARKGSGTSALATLEYLGFSVIVGHTHRQSHVHKTRYDIDGTASTLAACEIGCMCKIEDGLGYTPSPDWQQGYATAYIWPDNTFKLDLATYVGGSLYWRDQRYS